jgi:O-antigen/teichoic acid export membrane protein
MSVGTDSVRYVLTSMTAQMILILAQPLLSRIYDPKDQGVAAIFTSILGVLTIVATFGFERAVAVPANDDDATWIVWAGHIGALGVSLFCGIGILVFGSHIDAWFGQPGLKSYLLLLPVGVATTCGYQLLSAWAVRRRQFEFVSKTFLVQAIVVVCLQVALGVAGFGVWGILTATIVAGANRLRRMFTDFWSNNDRARTLKSAAHAIRQSASRYRRFSYITLPSSLMERVVLEMPVIFFAMLFATEVVGQYSLAYRIIAIPAGYFAIAISQLFVGKVGSGAATNIARLRELVKKTSILVFSAGLGVTAALAIGGPIVFELIFGQSWRLAGEFAMYLAPVMTLSTLAISTGSLLDVLEMQGAHLLRSVIRLCLILLAAIVSYIGEFPAPKAVMAISIGLSAGYAAYWIITLLAISRLERRLKSNLGHV